MASSVVPKYSGTVGQTEAGANARVGCPKGIARGRVLRHVWGLLVAGSCLLWAFHDVNWRTAWAHLRAAQWQWTLAAAACELSSYAWDATRWVWLLRPIGRIRWKDALRAIYAGLLANQIFPVRLGEVARAYALSRWAALRLEVLVPSLLLCRLLDGLAVVVVAGAAAAWAPLPADLVRPAGWFAISLLCMWAALAVFVYRDPSRIRAWGYRRSGAGPLCHLKRLSVQIAEGLAALRSPGLLGRAAATTLIFLIFQVAAFWLAMQAYGLQLDLVSAGVVFLILHVGTAIPSAPANVGSFQFFTVVGLSLYGVEKSVAAGFSVFAFAVLTAPLSAAGLLSLARSGLRLDSTLTETH